MKQVAIISGKGGTGKTTITAALASLFKETVFVDGDVDAPDLHLLLKPEINRTEQFTGGQYALIDEEKCTGCGKCYEICRFGAVFSKSERFEIDQFVCEGCGLCSRICPVEAIKMIRETAGEWYVSESRFGNMVHARLFPGQENSGKLITMIRHQAKILFEESGTEYILIDGPPGTGCPVISTITGVDHVILITEPTVSGISDFKRTWDLVHHFEIPASCIINKSNLNPAKTEEIAGFCEKNKINQLGRIPFDSRFNQYLVQARVLTEVDDKDIVKIFEEIYLKLKQVINE